jgi:hypothetical protein
VAGCASDDTTSVAIIDAAVPVMDMAHLRDMHYPLID